MNPSIHWEELPHAIRPQGGTLDPAKKHPAMIAAKAFSGSGNVDLLNTAGLQTGKEKPIVLVYTDYGGDGEGLAYSNDRGRTWKCDDKNPIIPATPEQGGNDSKLVWYEPGKHWVLVHFMTRGFRGFTISTSPDLKTWTQTSRLPDFWECPELFEIPVDPALSNISAGAGGDSSATRWILWGGDAKYMIGKFDGKTFTPESKGRKQLHWGNYYASQCFTNAPDKRVIQVGWTRKIDMPGMPFNQAFSLPAELFLRSTASGLRLCAEPVRELETLRKPGPVTLAGKELNSSAAAVSFDVGGKGQLFDILLSVRKGTAERVTLAFGGNALGYDFKEQELDGMPLPLKDGKFQIRLIIDRPLYEVFGTDGSCHNMYRNPKPPPPQPHRASVLGECGALPLAFRLDRNPAKP